MNDEFRMFPCPVVADLILYLVILPIGGCCKTPTHVSDVPISDALLPPHCPLPSNVHFLISDELPEPSSNTICTDMEPHQRHIA